MLTITSGIKNSCRMKLAVGASTGGSERPGKSAEEEESEGSAADMKSVPGGPIFSLGGKRAPSTRFPPTNPLRQRGNALPSRRRFGLASCLLPNLSQQLLIPRMPRPQLQQPLRQGQRFLGPHHVVVID